MRKFSSLIAFIGLFAVIQAQCPSIVTRSQWGARAGSSSWLPIQPPPWVIIHHTEGPACSTRASCISEVKAVQNMHMDRNGWADIGYNFLVGGDNAIYEGRGWGKQGAHAPGYNDRSIGISFLGTYFTRLPAKEMLDLCKSLIACGVSNNYISSSYGLKGHRQAIATDCPGDALFNEIKTWPRFSP